MFEATQRTRGDQVTTLAAALLDVDEDLRAGTRRRPVWSTGLAPMDGHLGGGLHAGDLVLLGGPPGTGKTTVALQMARDAVASGGHALYVCFEHTRDQLTDRLMVMEGGLGGDPDAPSQDELMRHLVEPASVHGLDAAMAGLPGGPAALERLRSYASRLHLVGARGDATDIARVRQLALRAPSPPLVVVDLLQQLRPTSAVGTPLDDATSERAAAALKDLALELECPVLAVSAVDATGLASRRVRARHLQGSSSLAYEADVVLIVQEKYDVVARQHLVFDLTASEEHRRWLVCSVEKNRRGRDRLDMEFRKRFSHGHLDPAGRMVSEVLVDERVFTD